MQEQLFSKWRPAEFDFEGAKLSLSLQAPLMPDGRDFDRHMRLWSREVSAQTETWRKFLKGEGPEPEDVYALYDKIFGDEWALDKFKRLVRIVRPLTIDGKVIESGGELYGELGLGERIAIIASISGLSYLSQDLGKVFSSPSTSAVGTGTTADGGSPATSTEPEGGTVP